MKLFGPSRLGNVLIVGGLLLLIYIPVSYAFTELQGTVLQAQLRGELPPAAPVAVGATPATPGRSATLRQPAAINPPRPVVPADDAGLAATATALPAPAAEPTDTPPPTATPSPTPVPLGPPARVVFSSLRIDTGVMQMGWTDVKKPGGSTVSDWAVPKDTAGWAITSAALGVPGNVVLAAHNNVYGMVFRNISLAWPQAGKPTSDPTIYSSNILNGKTIELYAANGQRFDYEVTAFYRLQDYGLSETQIRQNADYMQPTPDPQLTLITCWPPWSNTYRLVVRAKLVSGPIQ